MCGRFVSDLGPQSPLKYEKISNITSFGIHIKMFDGVCGTIRIIMMVATTLRITSGNKRCMLTSQKRDEAAIGDSNTDIDRACPVSQ
jgi:hypothetical protein